MKRWWTEIGMAVVLCTVGAAYGGSLDSPAAPTDPGSAMYTLEDICQHRGQGATFNIWVDGRPVNMGGGWAYGQTLTS